MSPLRWGELTTQNYRYRMFGKRWRKRTKQTLVWYAYCWLTRFNIGEYQAAVEGFREASDLRPDKYSHFTCLGKVYLRWAGHEAEALEALTTSLRLKHTSVAANLAAKAQAALEESCKVHWGIVCNTWSRGYDAIEMLDSSVCCYAWRTLCFSVMDLGVRLLRLLAQPRLSFHGALRMTQRGWPIRTAIMLPV